MLIIKNPRIDSRASVRGFLFNLKLMAKELPYFKFEPNKWENGNIQMLSREDKGLFIDICSMYWSRLGDLPEKLVVQKLCGGNASALRSLYEEGIIALESDRIYIDFLTVQLQEFDSLKSQNSKNAKERWRKHRQDKELSVRNASASNSQCENDAIREDKKREEEIRVDKKKEEDLGTKKFVPPTQKEVADFFYSKAKDQKLGFEYSEIFAEKFISHYELTGWKYGKTKTPIKNWKLAVSNWDIDNWINEQEKKKNNGTTNKNYSGYGKPQGRVEPQPGASCGDWDS